MRSELVFNNGNGRTVTMVETMIMMMLAIAETTALMAPPMAEKIAPYECTRQLFGGERILTDVRLTMFAR